MAGRVVEEVFTTGDPMAETPGQLTPLPWPGWSGRMRSLEVDGARADYIKVDPYRLEVPPVAERRGQRVRMLLVVVLEGSSVGDVDGEPLVLSSTQAALIDGRASMRFEAVKPVRAVRLFVDQDHLPAEALGCKSLPFARLKPSPLVSGVVGFITGLLQVRQLTVRPHDEVAVSQPLIALQASLLNEALHQQQTGRQPLDVQPDRRTQIETYIDAHLSDYRLTLPAIAEAVGLSLRNLHQAFQDSPTTPAAYLRSQRVVRAQELIAASPEPPNLAAIAAQTGIARDQLARLISNATGQTVRQWWEHHHSS